jgi:glycosyltransferase involved in cell wall biosynthesis
LPLQKEGIVKKIWLYMVAFNEEKLLVTNLEYYKDKLAKVIIYDHMSTDRTVEIAKSYGAEVRMLDTGGKIDDEILLHIKNTAWRESIGLADAVIVSDVDEILWHPQFNEHVENVLNAGFNLIEAKHSFMPTTYSPKLDELRGAADACTAKPLMFNPNVIDINYCIGAHSCTPKGPVKINRDFVYFHSHYSLGVDEVYRRRVVNASRLSDKNKKKGWGVHYTYSKEQTQLEYDRLAQHEEPFSSHKWDL